MSTLIEISELATRFEELVAQAAAGEEVVVTEGGVERARLVPIPPRRTEPRVAGLHAGAFVIAPDFDDELPDSFWFGEEEA